MALKSTMGNPASVPSTIAFSTPFWTEGMYSRGTLPPTTRSSNVKPAPLSMGSSSR